MPRVLQAVALLLAQCIVSLRPTAASAASWNKRSVTEASDLCEKGYCASMANAVIRHIPAKGIYVTKPVWWLESRLHFSFAEYWDDKRMNFGALRVFNDDLVKPRAGFGTHPHRDAEIFSYVVQGKLSHKDSMGNKEALGRGAVQYLSAGTGITHAEMNDEEETCRFLQIWFTPDRRGHTPQYGSSSYSREERHNRLLQVLGGTGSAPAWETAHRPHQIRLHQDANVFVSESDAGKEFNLSLGAQRQAYLMCIEGSLQANQKVLGMRDAAEITDHDSQEVPLSIRALEQGAHFIILEMAKE